MGKCGIHDSPCQLTLPDYIINSLFVRNISFFYSFILLWEVFQNCVFSVYVSDKSAERREKCITDLCWKCHFRSWNKYFPINLSCTLSIPLRWRSPPSSWLGSQNWSMFTYGSLSPSASCTWWPFLAIAPSSSWSGQSPHSMHPCTISFPCWLSLTWVCPSHPSPLCCWSLLSMLQEFPQVPALLKNSLSTDSQIWSPQCSWSCLLFAFWPSATPWDTAPSSPMPEWPKWIWCSSLKAFSYCSHFLSLLKDWPIVGRAYFLTLTVSIKMSWSLPALTTQSTFSMASLLLSLWWQTVCSLLCSMYSSWRLWWEFDPTRSSSKPSTPVFPTSVLCLSSMCPSSLQLPCTALASSSAQWPWS